MRLGRHDVWASRRALALLLAIVYALAPLQFARPGLAPGPAPGGSIGLAIPICSATGVRYVQLDGESAPARDGSGSSGQIPHPCCGICPCGHTSVATPITVVLDATWGESDRVSTPAPERHSGRLGIDHFDARAPPFSIAIIGQDLRRSVDS